MKQIRQLVIVDFALAIITTFLVTAAVFNVNQLASSKKVGKLSRGKLTCLPTGKCWVELAGDSRLLSDKMENIARYLKSDDFIYQGISDGTLSLGLSYRAFICGTLAGVFLLIAIFWMILRRKGLVKSGL